MKEKKKKSFLVYLVIILLIVAGVIAGVCLLKENKTNDNSSKDNTNPTNNNFVIEEDVEEIKDNYIYIRKTFTEDGKHAKIEYKYENSMYEIKINDNVVKNAKLTNKGDCQINQLKDAIVIAIKKTNSKSELSIFAFDFTGKEILTIDDYLDADNYMSLREYGDSDKFDNWAFQITDSKLMLLTGRVNAGDIDGISNPCNKTEIAEAKITNDTMMAAQYSISYLGNSKFSDAKMERVTIDYLQYKKVFPCR